MTITTLQLPLGPLQTNCYILGCQATRHAAVIDPSWDGRAIKQKLDDEGLQLTHILLTHTHFDHVGGLAELKTLTGAPIYVHPQAVSMLAQGADMARLWDIPMEQPPPADEPARNASAAAGPAADAAERVDRVQSASPAEDRAASVEDAITDARAIAGAAFSGFICWFPREPRRRRPATPSRHRQP